MRIEGRNHNVLNNIFDLCRTNDVISGRVDFMITSGLEEAHRSHNLGGNETIKDSETDTITAD